MLSPVSRVLSLRLSLMIELNPSDDLNPARELLGTSTSGALEEYPESKDDADRLLALLKREGWVEGAGEGSKLPTKT